jgi:hypothetical protein
MTVHRLGKDLGAGGLAGAAGTYKKIGVGQTAHKHLIPQGACYMLLTDHIVKGTGTVFSVKRLVHVSHLLFANEEFKMKNEKLRYFLIPGIKK